MSMMDWRVPVLVVLLVLIAAVVFLALRMKTVMSTRQLIGFELDEGEFQRALSAGLRQQGYQVEDGGEFLVMRRSGETTLLSSANWDQAGSARKRLGRLARAIRQQHAAGGKLVSAGAKPSWFLSDANSHSVEWIDAKALASLLSSGLAHEHPPTVQLVTSFMPERLPLEGDAEGAPPGESPQCPRCGSAMTLEVADQGGAQGQRFWRCTRFGECKGIRAAKQA